MMEKIVAQVELDVTRNADDDPASKKLKDAFGQCYDDHQQGVESELLRGPAALFKIVERELNDLRGLYGDAVQQEHADRPHHEAAAVLLQVWIERTEAFGQHR